ncbi:MAG: hypothetical protein ABIM99_03020 [Candidatus Dojkabacteria bacterium]
MKRKVLKAIAYTFLILGLLLPFKLFSNSITFSAQVGDTILILKGYTSPNSLVTFIENNVVIGTIASDSSGYFEKNFTAQNDGIHQIQIHSTDIKNISTPVITKEINLISFQTTEINDIVLPPTVTVNQSFFNTGDILIIKGYTIPNTQTELLLNGSLADIVGVLSDSNGFFIYQYPANNFINGNYKFQVFIKDALGQITGKSFETPFNIYIPFPTTPPVVSPIVPPITIVSTPVPTPISESVSTPTEVPVEQPLPPSISNSNTQMTYLICLICTCSLIALLLLIILILLYKSDDDEKKKKQSININ